MLFFGLLLNMLKAMNPKVSIVMPVFNQERFLKESILSILIQSYKNFEFLILDDCSTDKSLNIIKSHKDRRIKLYQNKKRQGITKSLNYLVKTAKGKYIARMDGDDISLPDRLQKQARFLAKHKETALVGSWAKIIDERGMVVSEFKYPTNQKKIRRVILGFNPFIHPSVMFRKKVFEKVGGYDENLLYSQDYDLFLRLVINYPCVNLPFYLLKFRWDPNLEKQKKQHLNALKIRLKAVEKYGYNRREILKLIRPALLYFIPIQIKKIFWQRKLS